METPQTGIAQLVQQASTLHLEGISPSTWILGLLGMGSGGGGGVAVGCPTCSPAHTPSLSHPSARLGRALTQVSDEPAYFRICFSIAVTVIL